MSEPFLIAVPPPCDAHRRVCGVVYVIGKGHSTNYKCSMYYGSPCSSIGPGQLHRQVPELRHECVVKARGRSTPTSCSATSANCDLMQNARCYPQLFRRQYDSALNGFPECSTGCMRVGTVNKV
eukprot:3370265-Amphidinium_carterae.1